MPVNDGSYDGIMLGEKPIGGFSPMPGKNGWSIYITVDDVDTRLTAAQENGATVMSEAMTMPGVGRMATIKDPFGASICFIDYTKA